MAHELVTSRAESGDTPVCEGEPEEANPRQWGKKMRVSYRWGRLALQPENRDELRLLVHAAEHLPLTEWTRDLVRYDGLDPDAATGYEPGAQALVVWRRYRWDHVAGLQTDRSAETTLRAGNHAS